MNAAISQTRPQTAIAAVAADLHAGGRIMTIMIGFPQSAQEAHNFFMVSAEGPTPGCAFASLTNSIHTEQHAAEVLS
eukprot:CAMPEP_0172871998 /NCGR_PEP_ID=MMETSP1075-20121228/92401_1 /TAXON_ID=2916 /ORGANISM="Ceratium fusus, Strain PA161109" /LENGTH=76 /DNA_ID=CAMNT_0013722301 /DNA_START=19 /DNA_END=249 /DNA_ORIENTATION=-